MNLDNLKKKPFDDPVFSTNTSEVLDSSYDSFFFAWEIYGEDPKEKRLVENLKDFGALSVAGTDKENIDRIVEDFVPYNFSFLKFRLRNNIQETYKITPERSKNLRSILEKIISECVQGKFEKYIDRSLPVENQHITLMFNIFVTPQEKGRKIFDIKENTDGPFPIYNEPFTCFAVVNVSVYETNTQGKLGLKRIDLSKHGIESSNF